MSDQQSNTEQPISNYKAKFRSDLFFLLAILAIGFLTVLLFQAFTPGKAHALDLNNCLSCHKEPTLTKPLIDGGAISVYVDKTELDASAHRYIDCVACHTLDPANTSYPHPAPSELSKQSLAEKCGSCHEYEYALHLQSIHGEQLTQGNSDVATCVDCHSSQRNPHSVMRTLEYDASTYKKNISQTCAKCHDNAELMGSYGIVEKVYESYMRSFHGKAIQLGSNELGQLNKATCTNCHGVHDIKSIGDPNSPVAGIEALVTTCEQCHPGAGTEFASGFLGHKEVTRESAPIPFFVEKFFLILFASVVATGLFVTLSALIRWSINRWRE